MPAGAAVARAVFGLADRSVAAAAAATAVAAGAATASDAGEPTADAAVLAAAGLHVGLGIVVIIEGEARNAAGWYTSAGANG